MLTRRTEQVTAVALILGLTALGSRPIAQEPVAPQLVVTGAAADASGQALTITGENFGTRVFVTLDLVPLPVRSASDTRILASAPVDRMPPGTYLLSVSRGPSPGDNGSFQVTLPSGGAKQDAPVASDAGPATLGLAAAEPAVKVGDRTITIADVDREWRRTDPAGYVAISRAIYENQRRAADRLVSDALLAREAATHGLTTQGLLDVEIPKRIVTMPESAVLSLYQSLGDKTRGATFELMRPALRAWLERNTQPELAKMNYLEELMKVSTRAVVFLAPPRVRVDLTAQDVTLGPASAAVDIVAFGDFQSPEYARFAAAFGKVRDTFGDRVRIVFKHLPALGPESVLAGEAAACANAQGKFWAYHDALVTQQVALRPDRLKAIASDAGVDRRAFDACLDGGTFTTAIRQAAGEAERYSIRSSPSFLVNGALPLPPPFLPPFEFFKRIIEEELSRQTQAAKGR